MACVFYSSPFPLLDVIQGLKVNFIYDLNLHFPIAALLGFLCLKIVLEHKS